MYLLYNTNRKKILKTKRLSSIMVLFSDIPHIKQFYLNIKPNIDAIYNFGISCGVSLFKCYINTYTYIQTVYNQLYSEYPYFTLSMDNIDFYKQLLFSWIGNYHVEPNEKGWMLTQFLMKNKKLINSKCYETCLPKIPAYLCKELEFLPKESIDSVTTKYDESVDAIKSIVFGSYKIQEGLSIMKLYDYYTCRSVFRDIPICVDRILPIQKCKNHFINVEYTHPDLKHTIPIDLTHMYLVNNIVLSPLFLHYILSLQPLSYIIDDEYIINIMDQDINMFQLTYYKYIIFDKDQYYVKEWSLPGKYMGSDQENRITTSSSSSDSISDIDHTNKTDSPGKHSPHPEYSSDSM